MSSVNLLLLFDIEQELPPPGTEFRITDSGERRIADNGDDRITD